MGIFSDKKAVVIGGSGGIGRAVSQKLAATGAFLTVHGRHDNSSLDSFLEDLNSISNDNTPSKKSGILKAKKAVFELTLKNYDSVCSSKLKEILIDADIVCVCFGPFIQKPLAETSFEDWNEMALLNYALPGFCISTALPHMIEKKWGRFLLFGGTRTYTINGFKTNPAYAGAKTGVCSLVRSAAQEYANFGITCNAILPGFAETEYLSESTKEILRKKSPSGSLIPTENIAECAMFLLQNSKINGALLNVDDGWDGGMNNYFQR